MHTLRLVGNILWLVLGGVELALGYMLAGLVCLVLIVTIPFGIQAIKLGIYTLWPFGRALVPRPERGRIGSAVGNLVWFVVGGLWIAIGHVTAALACALTIIGIPFAVAHLKIARAALFPFGKEIVPLALAPRSSGVVVTAPLGA